jgi:hypothetical protein
MPKRNSEQECTRGMLNKILRTSAEREGRAIMKTNAEEEC